MADPKHCRGVPCCLPLNPGRCMPTGLHPPGGCTTQSPRNPKRPGLSLRGRVPRRPRRHRTSGWALATCHATMPPQSWATR